MDNIILESVIDPTREDLDAALFDRAGKEYKLKSYIKRQLEDAVDEVDKEFVSVNDWFIKGSILSYQWLPWSDVDILIEIDDMPDEEWEELRGRINARFENVNIAGTKHPIQIFPQRGEYDPRRADGIYDVKSDRWIKGPYDIVVDIHDYIEAFSDKARSFDTAMGELERDVIDYSIFQSLTPEEMSALSDQSKQKLDEIDQDIDLLIQKRDEVRDARWAAFDKEMSPEELERYTTKNKLPANVVQKMLERYKYFGMISALKKAKEQSGDKIDEPGDVERVKTAIDIKPSALESLDRRLQEL